MKVSVIGAGYVGLVTAACLAELGHDVICMDSDSKRISLLLSGFSPIYEPGLEALIQRNTQAQRLHFSLSFQDTLEQAEILFIAVGTPPKEDGSADLEHVLNVASKIGKLMTRPMVVVNKSTVPVGTADAVEAAIRLELMLRDVTDLPFAVVSNPEFLKEGDAIEDFMRPDRIVIGVGQGNVGEMARTSMSRLYASLNRHHERTVWMDVRSAELTKYAANAMLATRISFMNEIANLADEVNADVDAIRRGIGSDSRIGPSFLYAGTGYGGSCFPKDTRALIQTAQRNGTSMEIVQATERVNQVQRQLLIRRITERFGENLQGHCFAIWGLAFKPQTDDMREAPSRLLIRQLIERGAEVQVHDPIALHAAKQLLAEDLADLEDGFSRVRFYEDAMAALHNCNALVVVTEWKHFHNPDFEAIKQQLRQPCIIDGRNLFDPQLLQDLGIAYQGIGRRNALACVASRAEVQANHQPSGLPLIA